VLDWVVRRASESQQLDGVVVVMPQGDCVDDIASIAPPDAILYASSMPDSLSRLCDAMSAHLAESVVMIPLAAPLIDPTLIDRLVVAAHQSPADYATFCFHSGSLLHAKLGLVAEWYRVAALETANRMIRDQRQREDFSRFIVARPDLFSLRLLPLPKELDRHDLRLSLQTQEDWDHVEQVVEALGHDQLDWKQIALLIDRQPLLRDRMAILNRSSDA
jgi:spore coat polysaccharide biosynthesis protein SpsF